ncbi:hypothetical protein JCM6882_007587 [Rhodosporidiobolus microsporus]
MDVRLLGWIMDGRRQELLVFMTPLRRLVLHDIRTVDQLHPVVFPNLQALTVRDCHLPPLFLCTLLEPYYVPRLLHLRVSHIFNPQQNLRRYLPVLGESSLRPLESLHVEISDLKFMDSGPDIHTAHVLVSASIQDLSGMVALPPYSPFPLRHLHVPSFLSDPYHPPEPNLSRLIILQGLANLADFLPSSSLSASLLPADMKDPLFAEQHDAILKACDEKGIKVLWEMEALDDKRGLWMRDEFHRGVVRKKREGGQAR